MCVSERERERENVSCETRSPSAAPEVRLRSLVHGTFDLLKEQSDVPSKSLCVCDVLRASRGYRMCAVFSKRNSVHLLKVKG